MGVAAGVRATVGATLYVTLEPCNHYGLTPPCTERIIESGITRVVYGFKDPNPRVKGGGTQRLKEQGILVDQITTPAIDAFYGSYRRWTETGLPTVALKLALSLDGKIAGDGGKRVKISGPEFDELTHRSRRSADAILTTARTIINDNPRLDVRLAGAHKKRVYILDSKLSLLSRPDLQSGLQSDLQIFDTAAEVVLFHRAGPWTQLGTSSVIQTLTHPATRQATQMKRCRLQEISYHNEGLDDEGLDLAEALAHIGQEGVHDLWVECGARLSSRLWSLDRVDELILGVSPLFLGEKALSGPLTLDRENRDLKWQILGRDAICFVRKHVHRNH